MINKPARNEEGELKRLQSADKHLEGEDKRRFVEREIYRERDNFQTGRRFMKGLKGSYMVAEAGYQRMLGNDDKADQIQDRLNNPARQAKLGYLQKMANEQGDFHRLYLEEELEQTFVGDLAEGAGGVAGQIGMVTASGPLGFVTLTGQVTGQVYEGNYQRSYSERLDKELAKVENLSALTDEDFESIKSKAKEEAKEDAKNNIWSAVPELALDAIFLKGAGKLLKGKAGTTTDKLTTFTIGSLAEGSSEAVSSALQNYMVQRNIDPDQQVSEGVLYDFALGTILGTTVNTLSIGTGAGEGQLIQDVQGFRKAVLKRAKEDSKKGDEKATKFLKEYSDAMERIHVSDGDGLKSVSVGAGVEKGMTPQQVLDAIGEDKDISESLPIHVIDKVENIGSIDESLGGKFTSEDGIEGLYVGKDGDKKVILVADQLGSVADVKRVLRHESIGHFGTEVVSGQMSSLFYERVGRDYVNTPIGRRIVADYSNDPNFSVETLGKEIVARVSENPMPPVGFKQSLIDAFHKVTGNKISEGPETDSQIIKAITLADQVVPTPVAKKLGGPVTSAKVDVQDDVQQDDLDNVLASRGTGRKYGIPKDFEAEAEALTAGKPGQLVKLNETHALYQEFHSVVDYGIYDPNTGERYSRKPKYFGFTKYEDPDSNSEAVDKEGFPRKFVWAFQPLDNAYDIVETGTADFQEALAFAESEDMDRRIDLTEEDPSLDDVLFSKKGNLPPPENSQATQRKGTLPTYVKAKDFLDGLKEGGTTLDYGAGLGLGAEAMGADSFEPNPRETFVGGRPTYDSSKQIPSNSYDKLVTANVLNVIPNEDGSRDKVVKDIGRVLAPGGVAMIQTRDVSGVMGAKTATPGPEKNSIIAKTEGRETFQKGFDKDELVQYVSDVLGLGFNVSKIPSSAKISGSAVLVEKDAKVMGAIKQANQKILFSKKRQELKAGITRDKMGNLFYKEKNPWSGLRKTSKKSEIYTVSKTLGASPRWWISKTPRPVRLINYPVGLTVSLLTMICFGSKAISPV